MDRIQYIGIDVDDNAFHVAVADSNGEIHQQFKCEASASGLARQLDRLGPKKSQRLCYEATYLGFSLQRSLDRKGYDCRVIAPSSIPQAPGQTVKTNRKDCEKLARLFAKDMLVEVEVPDPQTEQDRALIRSRHFLVEQRSSLKRHVLSFCRQQGWHYLQEQKVHQYWTKAHHRWLEEKMKKASGRVQRLLSILLGQLRQIDQSIESLEEGMDQMSGEPRYEQGVKALRCFKGVATTTALTILAEIGDIRRFSHPRQLVSYAGIDLREYSSGDKEVRWKISKMGSRHLRRVLVESAQLSWRSISCSKEHKRRKKEAPPEFVEIAERCQKRLYLKGWRLHARHKPLNKIKVACARESLGFIWESLQKKRLVS